MAKQLNPLKPPTTLLVKVASLVVHADEFLSPDGGEFDKRTILSGLQDPEVRSWLAALNKMSLIPRKRKGNDYR